MAKEPGEVAEATKEEVKAAVEAAPPTEAPNKAKKRDLSELDITKNSNKPYRLQLLDPYDGEPLDMFIWHVGRESDIMREHFEAKVDARLAAAARGEADEEPATVAKNKAEAVDNLTVAIFASEQEWEGVELNGAPLAFTVPNIKLLLTKYDWARSQVHTSVNKLANFTPASQNG